VSVAEATIFSDAEMQALGKLQELIRAHISPPVPERVDPAVDISTHNEPMQALAQFSYDWAPLLCGRDSACENYHRAWSMVRVLETGGALRAGGACFQRELERIYKNGGRRILICGAADTGLLAIVVRVMRGVGCEKCIVLVDRCQTALEQNRLYARYLNL